MQILDYFKKQIMVVILIILLLSVQAIGIIILPEYIAKLVDVGIERYGIENAVPLKIRQDEMDKLMIFINDTSVLDNFELSDDNIYCLKDNSNIEELDYKFARAETLLLIVNNDESVAKVRAKIKTNITSDIRGVIGENKSILDTLLTLDHETLLTVNQVIDSKLEVLTDDILGQISSKYLSEEYETLGIRNIQTDYIIKTITIMLLIAVIVFASYCVEAYYSNRFSANLAENLRNKTFKKVLNMKEEKFNEFELTSLINRTVNDINMIQKSAPIILRTFIYGPIIFIGSYIKVLKFGDMLVSALIIVVLTIFIIGITLLKKIVFKEEEIRNSNDKLNSKTRDALNNLLIIKGIGKSKHLNKFKKTNHSIMKQTQSVMELRSLCIILLQLTVYLSSVYILWLGAIRIQKGVLTIGALIAITDYLFQISFIIIKTLKESIYLLTGYISYKRCRAIFKEDNNLNKDDLLKIDSIDSIEFKNVYFKYPNTKTYILKDFNIKINKNDHTTIVGNNASGKSTIIKLLLKFYAPNKGEILINGINIEKIETVSIRKLFAVVPQETQVFKGSLNDNIKLGNEEIKTKELEKIKQIAELKEFMNDNKELYYQGKNVSGGQKQRITIARALAKEFDILVLDEAFASLDTNTKSKIKDNIMKNYRQKIIIDIGQNIKDRIISNKIVEI